MSDTYQAIHDVFYPASVELQTAAQDYYRPSIQMRPQLLLDGNQWCALYGTNLQEGVAGFGDSPDLAFRDFDRNWFTKIPATTDTTKEGTA